MKSTTTLLLTLLSLQIAIAQHKLTPCGYELGIEAMEHQHPGYKNAVRQSFEQAKAHGHSRSDEVYTVQVVFHVVWNADEENIPDEKIYEQLDELNRCYRRQNPDTVNLRDEFLPVAGDPRIEFEITEIRRVKTEALFTPTLFGLPDQVKQSANGGSDAADTYRFLNIWICKLQPLSIIFAESPVLGYAYPPDSLANWPAGSAAPSPELQGVVVDYRTVGLGEYEVQGIGALPMLGRTMVHEIGHYLGLRHISGDGSVFIGVDCNATDGVDDTPTQGKQSEFNCDETQNTCFSTAAGDLPDMIENYMDYSSEDCQNSFTQGQINIMRAVLEGPRKGIVKVVSDAGETPQEALVGVAPNPSTGRFSLLGNAAVQQFTVLNSLGKVVVAPQQMTKPELDLSAQPAGVYWLSIKMANGEVVSRKLVKH
jgi:hypothetical protein